MKKLSNDSLLSLQTFFRLSRQSMDSRTDVQMRKIYVDEIGLLMFQDICCEFQKYGEIESISRIEYPHREQAAVAIVFRTVSACEAAAQNKFPVIRGQQSFVLRAVPYPIWKPSLG